jgi:hypothetical protein
MERLGLAASAPSWRILKSDGPLMSEGRPRLASALLPCFTPRIARDTTGSEGASNSSNSELRHYRSSWRSISNTLQRVSRMLTSHLHREPLAHTEELRTDENWTPDFVQFAARLRSHSSIGLPYVIEPGHEFIRVNLGLTLRREGMQ